MIQTRAVPRTALALMFALVGCGDSPSLLSTDDPTLATLPAASATAGTITLITGDRVTVQSVTPNARGGQLIQGAPKLTAGPGRGKIPVTITQRNGEYTVMPQDMAPLVASGQLDPQLFNVTRLLADGFGDDKRGDLPLVVTDPRDTAALQQATITLGRTMSSPHTVAVRQDKGAPSPLLASLVAPTTIKASDARSARMTRISLDRPDQPVADQRAALRQGASRGDVAADAPSFDLTLSVLDTSGQDVGGSLFLVGIDPGTGFVTDFISGPTTFNLPAGRYMVWTLDAVGSANMVAPRFLLAGDSTLVMDGRLSKPVDVQVAGQDLALSQVSWAFTDRESALGISTSGPTIQAGQIGADAPPGEVSSVATALLVPTAEPTSPSAVYTVAEFAANRFFTGVKERLRGRDFATVHAHHAGAAGTTFTKNAGGIPPDNSSLNFVGASYVGPFDVTEHYFGRDFQWITSLDQGGDFFAIAGLQQIVEYHAGQTTTEQWNRAPLSPAFSGIHEGPFGVLGAPFREGDVVIADVSLFSDASRPPHAGFTEFFDTSHARLLRNGAVFEDIDGLASPFASFEATPESAEYRIEQEVTRSTDMFDLSTEITSAITFRTQHTDARQILPLPTLRFSPALDNHNQTRARALVLPVHVERVAGAPTPRIAHITVDASFDDGATWVHVPLIVAGADAFGLIVHPPGATHVSLRGSTSDVQGNAAEVKIIRAYGLAPH